MASSAPGGGDGVTVHSTEGPPAMLMPPPLLEVAVPRVHQAAPAAAAVIPSVVALITAEARVRDVASLLSLLLLDPL